ncbi:MAG: tryptophan synthase subunit alpha [Gammaproteobacteria bacterium]
MLKTYLEGKLKESQLLLMTHCVVGYPSLEENWRMLEGMRDAGVALVELQMPFSEPIADGPLFVKANQLALESGLHRDDYFDFMQRASAAFDFPLLFMGYYNSVFCMGEAAFCRKLKDAGAQGYIIADLPPQEAIALDRQARDKGLHPIHLMTPTNTEARLREIAANASGFIYCVARTGVTGKQTVLDSALADYIQRCRRVTDLPVALGFGIRTVADINMLKGQVDIAVIGTACLEIWERHGEQGYREFLESLHEVT